MLGALTAFALLPGSAGGAHTLTPIQTIPKGPIISTVISTTYTLTVNVSGGGTVSSNPAGIACPTSCVSSFQGLTTPSVTLTAKPNSVLFVFDGWSGGCSGGGTCTVSSTTAVTATFSSRLIISTITKVSPPPTTYSLTVVASGPGSLASAPAGISCGSTCTAAFPIGTSVTLTATPNPGDAITGWSGDGCTGTGATCTVTAGGTVTVTFAAPATTTTTPTTTTTTPTTTTSGPVIASTPTTTTSFVPPNLLTVTVGVTGGGTVTGKASGSGKGIACGAKGSTCFGKYKPGTTVAFRAGAAEGFHFTGWGGGCSGASGLSCVIKVEHASTVSARFTPVPHAAIVPVEISAAAFSVQWQESVGTGKLLVHGRIAKSAQVEVRLARSGGAPLVTEHLSLSAGPFSLTLKLEPGLGLLPGGFVVTISGHSGNLVVPPQVKTLSLSAPPEGVVDRAFASSSQNGPPAVRLRSSSKAAFVHFEFQSQPRAQKGLTISWYRPNGQLLGTAPKPRAQDVTSSIRSGEPLPPGKWRVDLRSGKTLVKSVPIQVG